MRETFRGTFIEMPKAPRLHRTSAGSIKQETEKSICRLGNALNTPQR